MIIQIAAAAENNALGKDNKMVWNLPDDYKRFREITSGHYIILGRKTFESLEKPLKNRTHVIITRDKNYEAENCIIVNSIEEAINAVPKDQDTFIIGGAEIYKQSIHLSDKIELTRVHTTCDADAFFPEIDTDEWELVAEILHPKDERHAFDFTYLTYVKR